MIHHETLPGCYNKADCYVGTQYSVVEAVGGYLPLDGTGPGYHGRCQPLSEAAVLAEAQIALLGEADWRTSGCNWSGTDFVALRFLAH